MTTPRRSFRFCTAAERAILQAAARGDVWLAELPRRDARLRWIIRFEGETNPLGHLRQIRLEKALRDELLIVDDTRENLWAGDGTRAPEWGYRCQPNAAVVDMG